MTLPFTIDDETVNSPHAPWKKYLQVLPTGEDTTVQSFSRNNKAAIFIRELPSKEFPPEQEGYTCSYFRFRDSTFGSYFNGYSNFAVYVRDGLGLTFNGEVPVAKPKLEFELECNLHRKMTKVEEHYSRVLRKGWSVGNFRNQYPELKFATDENVDKTIYRYDPKVTVGKDFIGEILHPDRALFLSDKTLYKMVGYDNIDLQGVHFIPLIVPCAIAEYLARQILFCLKGLWGSHNYSLHYNSDTKKFERYDRPADCKLKMYDFSSF